VANRDFVRPSARPLLHILLMAAAFGAGYALHAWAPFAQGQEVERATLDFHRLTTPYVECAGELGAAQRLAEARQRIQSFLQSERQRDPGLDVSLYARDLHHGGWVGINEDERFVAASMLKVPALFHMLASLEDDPTYLHRTVVYPGPNAMPSPANTGGLAPEQQLVADSSYTYGELLEHMIAYSDNHAKDLLLRDVPWAEIEALMQALNVEIDYSGVEPRISPRSLAALFRILYNSSFFSRPVSELGLGLLARSQFPQGLAKYTPEGTIVASKYGIHAGDIDGPHTTQVHECGLIYHPDGPLVVCVMTRSALQGQAELIELVARIGRLIQEEVTRH
jgi:hypothetical protein